jgi:hypothetical protein
VEAQPAAHVCPCCGVGRMVIVASFDATLNSLA